MNLVFDLGGVVLRWQPLQLLQAVLPHHAPDEAQARRVSQAIFQSFQADGDWAAFDRGVIDADEVGQRIAHRTGFLSAADLAVVTQAVLEHLRPMPESLTLLGDLRSAGHRLFYLSNMPAAYADALLERDRFFEWFDDGVFSSRLQLIKPEPAIFQAASQQFGVAPRDLLFIDDLPHNIEAAQAQGWRGVCFQNAVQCRVALGSMGVATAPEPP
ncbi:MAG: HAD family phosphatase [Pseudomonadota bacterium]